MNKTVLLLLLGIFSCSTAGADEMIVNFQSGNALIIQYTGAIQGVALQGKSDAIVGMNMQEKTTLQTSVQSAEETLVEQEADNNKEKKENQKSGIKWKWADPKTED